MKIDQNILEIIEAGQTEGNLYFLPPKQLDRDVYIGVNKVLEALGGKWNRKAKAHVFEQPIDEAIQNVLLTGEVTSRKNELQFFETPDSVADLLCELAELKDEHYVLEPEAGKGKIIRALVRTRLNLEVYWYEIDPNSYIQINTIDDLSGIGECRDFLSVHPDEITAFDRIVMNPPFSMNGTGSQTDIDHVTHAIKFLDDGGILVSVMSPAIKYRTNKKTNDFRVLLSGYRYEVVDLPDGSFKESGTEVRTVILKIWK